MARPLVSAGMIAETLDMTPQAARRIVGELGLREMTGRGRFRAWGILSCKAVCSSYARSNQSEIARIAIANQLKISGLAHVDRRKLTRQLAALLTSIQRNLR